MQVHNSKKLTACCYFCLQTFSFKDSMKILMPNRKLMSIGYEIVCKKFTSNTIRTKIDSIFVPITSNRKKSRALKFIEKNMKFWFIILGWRNPSHLDTAWFLMCTLIIICDDVYKTQCNIEITKKEVRHICTHMIFLFPN